MEKRTIKRGYLKWEDKDGFHKEPLYDHPTYLKNASTIEKADAEALRELNGAPAAVVEQAPLLDNAEV